MSDTNNEINEKDLAIQLKAWFDKTNTNTAHFWNRNLVGRVLKRNMVKWKRWKNAPRGMPIKEAIAISGVTFD